MTDSVQVAVRVRPFNDREKDMGSELIISMNGPSTTITDPITGKERTFTFDFSYNSFDPKVRRCSLQGGAWRAAGLGIGWTAMKHPKRTAR